MILNSLAKTPHPPLSTTAAMSVQENGKRKQKNLVIFKRPKHFRNRLSPRHGASDTTCTPQQPSSRKLEDLIHRIRRVSLLAPECPAEKRESDQQGKSEPKSHKLKSRTAYSRILRRIAVASNNPPVQQEKWYLAMRDGQVVRTPGPSVLDPSHQHPLQPSPSTSAIMTQTQGANSIMITPTSTPGSSTDIECGCCGFFISVRRR